MALDSTQRGVLTGMAAAGIVTALAALVALRVLPARAAADLADRGLLAARCALAVLAWPLVMVGNIARQRFFSPRDIAGSSAGAASPAVAHNQAVLQNTLEQAVLAVGAHVALAFLLPPVHLNLVPTGVVLFGVGRATFWWGYPRGAAARSFGFALTFYPTVALYVCAARLALRG